MKKVPLSILLLFLISCQENQPPDVGILSPLDNAIYVQGEDIAISVNAEDPDGTIEEVRLFHNNVGLASLTSFPYNYELNSEGLEPGSHTIKALAIDDQGLEATDEHIFLVHEKETNENISINGYVQKGPYLNGTGILITELDANLNQTGKNFTTQISDNTGRFHISNIAVESDFLELRADGFYFDEILGETSSAQLTLFALVDIQDSITVNINILTHLEKSRIEYLISTGLSFSESKQIAQEEVLALFHINKENVVPSEFLDISKVDDDNAILLAISLILQSGRPVAELTEILANIGSDIREDGILDNQIIQASLFNNAHYIDTVAVKSILDTRFSSLDVDAKISAFGKYIDEYMRKQNPYIIEFDIQDATCFGFANGKIDLNVSGGTPPYSYDWMPGGESTEDLAGLSTGSYEVGITDANGYFISKSVTISEPEELRIQLESITDELNGSTGAVDISVFGGTVPYSYSWSNGDTIEDLSNLTYGNYGVSVTDSNACNASIIASVKGSFIDGRDNKEYIATPIGDQIWMGENLSYLPSVHRPSTGSETESNYYVYSYNGTVVEEAMAEANYNTFGVLYNWIAAQESCPAGWHLPSDTEWKQLEKQLGMTDEELNLIWGRGEDNNIGGKLKEAGSQHWLSPNTGATNESGFTALAGGYRNVYGTFDQFGYVAYFWSSTQNNTKAWTRLLDKDGTYISRSELSKIFGFSVRCVKD
ncbi:MAG: FISUMP domain-containing protein [Bacteroidota bacterium]